MKHAVTIAAVAALTSVALAQNNTRAIVPEQFLKARPPSTAKTSRPPATYKRVDRVEVDGKAPTMDLGVTIWRLRAAKPGEPARLLVQEPDAAPKSFTPERVGVGTLMHVGDRVRISVESPRAGYLYVIDREQYVDGSTSQPYLVFPTTRTRGGDNAVTAGRLIDIPAQDDRPPYFTIKPSRADQTGERLTLVVATQPLPNVTIGAEPAALTPSQLAGWESRGPSTIQRLEMIGGVGRVWSRAEQRAAADATRLLRQDDPPPQTIFRVVVTQPDLVIVNITLPQVRPAAK